MNTRAGLTDLTGRFDKVDRIIVMLFNPGRDREDVRIENDVFCRKADRLGEDLVSTLTNLDLARLGVRLPGFVKGHDHHSCAIGQTFAGVIEELRLPLFKRDRVHNRLALHTFQAGLDHLPFGAVNHHRNAGDIRLGSDEIEEGPHGRDRVQKACIHVHIDDLRAVLDLLTRHVERCGIVILLNQLAEFRRAGDVCAFADIDEGSGLFGHGVPVVLVFKIRIDGIAENGAHSIKSDGGKPARKNASQEDVPASQFDADIRDGVSYNGNGYAGDEFPEVSHRRLHQIHRHHRLHRCQKRPSP